MTACRCREAAGLHFADPRLDIGGSDVAELTLAKHRQHTRSQQRLIRRARFRFDRRPSALEPHVHPIR